VHALNLNHSPEMVEFWVTADPFGVGAGHGRGARTTSAASCPRGLRQHRAIQRPWRNQACDRVLARGTERV